MKKVYLAAAATAALALAGCSSVPQLNPKNIEKVIAAMTIEEKALLVVGVEMDAAIQSNESATIGSSADLVPGAAGSTHAIPRLGIPAVVLSDGPAGLRINPTREGDENTYYCTHFPIGTLLSSTWNQELIEEVGAAIGDETHEYGADVLLAPALNIHRNPLCGRNFEYYSEDPILAGKTAAAYVRGVQSKGVGTSVKHFAFNNQETNRTGNNAIVSPRAGREIYLRGFEIVVKEADPWTVMTSYNLLNGTYTSERKDLLQNILRDEWGYKGTVMTDWYGGKDVVAQMEAGNDMIQPGRLNQYEGIVEAVKNGTLDEKVLDNNVRRILNLVVRSPRFQGYNYSNKPDLTAHAAVTRQSAVEGMVLLENKNAALPLASSIKKAAVFGNTSYDFIAGGTGSGNVNRAYTVSLLDGLKNAGISADENLQASYTKHIATEKAKTAKAEGLLSFLPGELPVEYKPTAMEIASAVKANDVAIITIGRISGEFLDRTNANFNLTAEEYTLVKNVSAAFKAAGKKTVVVLNIGGVIETASWKNLPDAVLLAWQAGQEGGNSVADVLTGKVSPSGKLPMTWPIKFEDHASSAKFPRAENFELDLSTFMGTEAEAKEIREFWDYTNYEEGIYVGYRWFDKQNLAVSYPFGFGLSYTTFEYSNATAKVDGNNIIVTVDVANTGAVAGKEAVQVYVSAPAGKLDKPVQELKAYAKTKELKAGEKQTLTMCFEVRDLASYDEASCSWVADAGTYTVKVGASSRDIRACADIEVAAYTEKTTDSLK
ncbi:MAG: glycoside hydrolase family 3 C-terminal domain-containing protein [Bacteroidales bacterium]|nr:glycoside hydrolase family 3 C-terminal domain-containing protein [Bacteroidales bacterium]